MISRRNAAIAVSLFAILAALYFFRAQDNSALVRKIDERVTKGFSSLGVSDNDLISRKVSYWRDGRQRGTRLEYAVDDRLRHDVPRLEKDLRSWLGGISGVSIEGTGYEKTGKSGGKTVFDVVSGGRTVLKLEVDNVRPGWTGVAEAVKPPKAPVAVQAATAEKETPVAVKKKAPMVAVVLDDFGYSSKNFDALKALGIPVTMAVLPNTPYTAMACDFARKNRMEVILHLPMEPKTGKDFLEKDTVMTGMSGDRITEIVSRDLRSVTGASGISNHMGSRATGDPDTMRAILLEAGRRKLYFLDSMTTGDSVVGSVAGELKVPYAERDIFLDNRNEKVHIRGQLQKVEVAALKKGSVVAIGHDRKLTIETMAEYVPEMQKRGIEFVTLSQLMSVSK